MNKQKVSWWLALTMSVAAGGGGAVIHHAVTSPTKTVVAPTDLYVTVAGLVSDADLDHKDSGTDNAPAIQAAVNQAIASGLPVYMPSGRYKIASTVVMSPAVNFTFAGVEAGRGGPDDTTRGTWLVWGGAPGGVVISLQGIKNTVRDLGIVCCRDTSIDACVDVESPSTYPNLSSQNCFKNIVAYGMAGPIAKGWVIGADGKPNNEFHWWKSCTTRYCTYAGIHVPSGTFQVKNCVCEDCTFGGPSQYGVVVATGSMSFWRCNWDSCDRAVKWFGGAYEPVQFLNCTGESNRGFLAAGGVQYVDMQGCRLTLNKADSPQVYGDEFLCGGANWTVRACTVEDPDNLNQWWRPGNSGTVCVEGVQCHSAQPLSTDNETTWKGVFHNFRTDQGNNVIPNGVWYQRNNVTTSSLGPAMVLGGGQWPPAGTFNGGTYLPAPSEAILKWDSGKLYVQTYKNNAWQSRQVQLKATP